MAAADEAAVVAAALAVLSVIPGAPARAGLPQAGDQPTVVGDLSTLKLGRYVCETPGDAGAGAAVPQPAFDFDVAHASMYQTRAGTGAYLLIATTVTMTDGPLAGVRFRRVSANFLRRLNPDGSDGRLRCVRQVLNNHQR